MRLQKAYFLIPMDFLHPKARTQTQLVIRWGTSREALVLGHFPLSSDKLPPSLKKFKPRAPQKLAHPGKLPDPGTIIEWLKRDECL